MRFDYWYLSVVKGTVENMSWVVRTRMYILSDSLDGRCRNVWNVCNIYDLTGTINDKKNDPRGNRTPNLRFWNPTRCHCAMESLLSPEAKIRFLNNMFQGICRKWVLLFASTNFWKKISSICLRRRGRGGGEEYEKKRGVNFWEFLFWFLDAEMCFQ